MISDSLDAYESISCPWASSVPQGAVAFGSESDSEEWDADGGIIHLISEENFVFLEKSDDEPCTLNIKLKDLTTQITNISVVSEAKIIEIYGKYGEYIKTCKCDYISEANGIEFYGAQTDLLTTHEITVKFPGVKKGIWLCGVKILIKKAPPSITNSFDYNLVDDKLKKSNIPITEKAEQFKKFLQDYATNKYNSTSHIDPHMLLKIMEGECLSHLKPVGNASRNISKYLTNLIPASLKSNCNNDNGEAEHEIKKENKDSANVMNCDQESPSTIKTYVDESLQKLEERLQESFKKQIEELEAKQNEKLDSILNLLRNSALR